VPDWRGIVEREDARLADGRARLPDDRDARQRQLTRIGNAAYGGGLAALMLGDATGAERRLDEAARAYRESFGDAPAGSWGRPIGAVKARLLAGDRAGARADAEWTLAAGAEASESPVGRYAAALALCVLERYEDARVHADAIRTRDDFPPEVGDALAFVAAEDALGYAGAVEAVLESFETRDEYLEDVPVADTVLVLQALAARRGMAVELVSPLLPHGAQ
jgi:hypothetical protein